MTDTCGPVDCAGTTWRACGFPGCPDRLDMAAVLAGEASPRGWLRNRLARYLCQDHGHGQHLPDWKLAERVDPVQAVPTCSCGWEGGRATNLLDANRQWTEHTNQCVEVTDA